MKREGPDEDKDRVQGTPRRSLPGEGGRKGLGCRLGLAWAGGAGECDAAGDLQPAGTALPAGGRGATRYAALCYTALHCASLS